MELDSAIFRSELPSKESKKPWIELLQAQGQILAKFGISFELRDEELEKLLISTLKQQAETQRSMVSCLSGKTEVSGKTMGGGVGGTLDLASAVGGKTGALVEAATDFGAVMKLQSQQADASKDLVLNSSSASDFRDFKSKFLRYTQIMGESSFHVCRFIAVDVYPGILLRLKLTQSEFEDLTNDEALEKMTTYQNSKSDIPILSVLENLSMRATSSFDRDALDELINRVIRLATSNGPEFANFKMKDIIGFIGKAYQPEADRRRLLDFMSTPGLNIKNMVQLVARFDTWSEREEHMRGADAGTGGQTLSGQAFSVTAGRVSPTAEEMGSAMWAEQQLRTHEERRGGRGRAGRGERLAPSGRPYYCYIHGYVHNGSTCDGVMTEDQRRARSHLDVPGGSVVRAPKKAGK